MKPTSESLAVVWL